LFGKRRKEKNRIVKEEKKILKENQQKRASFKIFKRRNGKGRSYL